MIAMAIEQTVDQMQIARSATARAHGEAPGRSRVRAGREGGRFLVTRVHPADRANLVEAVGQPIQTVAGHAPNPLDACRGETARKI